MNQTITTVVIVVLVLLAVFFFSRRSMSCFSPSPIPLQLSSFFDMNELSWIPSDVRLLLRNRINGDIIPSMSQAAQRSWNSIPDSEKQNIIAIMNTFFDNLKTELDRSNIELSVSSPSPA